MIVKNILQNKVRGGGVVSVSPDISIVEAAQKLTHYRIGALMVLEPDGSILGILSERDIITGLSQSANACLALQVRDLMTTDVLTCRELDSIDSVMDIMTHRRIRHLPVLSPVGRLVGMVTIGDVVKANLDIAHMDVESLRNYVVGGR